MSTFFLEAGKVYFCGEAIWKRVDDDAPPLAEDDQIETRRYYVFVSSDRIVKEISHKEAAKLLTAVV